MLTAEGHVKVMDFGLAKQAPATSESQVEAETVGALTESGVRIGAPGYMSPEQLLGGQVDESSDIFAFGILLYELLAGVHPFALSSQSGTMSAILRETPAPVNQYAKMPQKPHGSHSTGCWRRSRSSGISRCQTCGPTSGSYSRRPRG